MRTFIALEIPDNVKEKIFLSLNEERKKWRGVKWVEKENLHITLKFLGEVKEEKIPLISKVLDEVSERFKSFRLSLNVLGAFPTLKNPRIFWIGISPEEKVKEIFEFIEKKLKKLGFEKEKREFHPHITVARVKKRGNFNIGEKKLGDGFEIKEVILFKSELRPEGPLYTPLKRVRLKDE